MEPMMGGTPFPGEGFIAFLRRTSRVDIIGNGKIVQVEGVDFHDDVVVDGALVLKNTQVGTEKIFSVVGVGHAPHTVVALRPEPIGVARATVVETVFFAVVEDFGVVAELSLPGLVAAKGSALAYRTMHQKPYTIGTFGDAHVPEEFFF